MLKTLFHDLYERRAVLFGDLLDDGLDPTHHRCAVRRLVPEQIALRDPHNDKASQDHGSDQKEGQTQQDFGS